MEGGKLNRRICLYGGTFDPVHSAHVAVVRSFLDSGRVDEVWVVPALQSPFKADLEPTPYHHRAEMVKLAFSEIPRVKVCQAEKELPVPSYTLQTLRYLQSEYPACSFWVGMGGDNLAVFTKWHRYREILEKAALLVAARPGFDTRGVPPEVLAKTVLAAHTPVDEASTKSREKLLNGAFPEEIPAQVLAYIQRNKLYGR